MVKHSTVAEAYSVLGLDQGASLEVVKSTYKQVALRTHPDKNPGNAQATEQFQRVSEAYSVLLKHLDRSAPPPRSNAGAGSFFGGGYTPRRDYDDYDDYDDFSDEDYYDDESDYEDMEFYMYLFEEFMRDTANRYSSSRFRHTHPHYHSQSSGIRIPGERPYDHRPYDPEAAKRMREEQEAAAARRIKEEADRKATLEKQREQERKEAEARQKAKASGKKAKAEASKKSAEKVARQRQERAQALRSEVFAAARRNDSERVKKGVWEDDVDAAGGEVKAGHEEFVKAMPADRKETLLHIAAKNGDMGLVEWLNAHNAEPDERNSEGLTAFHVALRGGHTSIVKHFFKEYPTKDSDHKGIYSPPGTKTLLDMAIASGEPEAIRLVLDKKIASKTEIREAWNSLPPIKGQPKPASRPGQNKSSVPRPEEIRNLLVSYGEIDPNSKPQGSPPSPSPASESVSSSESSIAPKTPGTDELQSPPHTGASQGRGRGRGGKQGAGGQHGPEAGSGVPPPAGRGRSKGKGKGRGRGRG